RSSNSKPGKTRAPSFFTRRPLSRTEGAELLIGEGEFRDIQRAGRIQVLNEISEPLYCPAVIFGPEIERCPPAMLPRRRENGARDRALLAIKILNNGRHREPVPVAVGLDRLGRGPQPVEMERGTDDEINLADLRNGPAGGFARLHGVEGSATRPARRPVPRKIARLPLADTLCSTALQTRSPLFAEQPFQPLFEFADIARKPPDFPGDVAEMAEVAQAPERCP